MAAVASRCLAALPPLAGCRRSSSKLSQRAPLRPVAAIGANEVAEVASLAGAVTKSLGGPAAYFASLDLPPALVKYGHPGNMAVVLAAMGGYGSYLGWRIRLSDDADEVAAAREKHAALLIGALVFFSLGATGGMMSLLMQGKPVLESAHVKTAFLGIFLLATQASLPLFFAEGGASARTAHAYFGTAVMGLFVIHAGLGVQLALGL